MKAFFKTLLGRAIIEPDEAGMVVVTTEHAAVNAGKCFSGRIAAAVVANNGYLYIELIIPAGLSVNLKDIELYSSGSASTFDFLEAPTITNGTTAITPINRDRSSSNTSALTAYSDPTAISAGTTLDGANIGAGSFFMVGGNKSDGKWKLLPSTKYLLRLKNVSGGNAAMYINVIWYEYSI